MDHAPGGQAIRGPEWWQGKRGVKAGAKGRDAGAAGAQSEKLPLHNNTQQWLRRRAPTGHRRRSALKGRKPQSQGALRPGLECGGAVAVLVLTACAKEDLADSAQQQKDKNRRDRREHRGGKRYHLVLTSSSSQQRTGSSDAQTNGLSSTILHELQVPTHHTLNAESAVRASTRCPLAMTRSLHGRAQRPLRKSNRMQIAQCLHRLPLFCSAAFKLLSPLACKLLSPLACAASGSHV